MVAKYIFVVLLCEIISIVVSVFAPQFGSHEFLTEAFRKDYTYEEATKTFYKTHGTALKFQEAVDKCQAEGANLALPETPEEASVLQKYYSHGAEKMWLALHDKFTDTEFLTLTGKSAFSIYTNWEEGHPKNENDDDECVGVDRNGFYTDINCDKKLRFVCTKLRSSIVYNHVCQNYDKAYKYDKLSEHCYKLHMVARNWNDAFKICRSEEADLTVINSEEEARNLVNKLSKYPVKDLKGKFNKQIVHLDFTDFLIPGVYQTSGGTALEETGYSDWATDQPDDSDDAHCGYMNRDGKLGIEKCADRAMFFCEKVLVDDLTAQFVARSGVINETK